MPRIVIVRPWTGRLSRHMTETDEPEQIGRPMTTDVTRVVQQTNYHAARQRGMSSSGGVDNFALRLRGRVVREAIAKRGGLTRNFRHRTELCP